TKLSIFKQSGAYYRLGDSAAHTAALDKLESLCGAESLWTAKCLLEKGIAVWKRGYPGEGSEFLGKAIESFVRSAPGSLALAGALINHSSCLTELGDFDVAEHDLRTSLAIFEKLGQEYSWPQWLNLGNIRLARGDLAGAEALYRKSLVIAERS